jgi:hypothetical protein
MENQTLEWNRHTIRLWVPWDGYTRFGSGLTTRADPMGLDTETLYDPGLLPGDRATCVVITVVWGDVGLWLWPEQWPEFLWLHRDCSWVVYNAEFDWWVLEEVLRTQGATQEREAWRNVVTEGRLWDAMLLDQLIRMARNPFPVMSGNEQIRRRDLGTVTEEWLGAGLDKNDPYRLRYGELLQDRSLLQKEPGFVEYAFKDALATYRLWPVLRRVCHQLRERYNATQPEARRRISREAVERYGPLSHHVQVQGALALHAVSNPGLRWDAAEAQRVIQSLEAQLEQQTACLQRFHPEIFVYEGNRGSSPGQTYFPGWEPGIARNPKTKTPKIRQKELRMALQSVGYLCGVELPCSETQPEVLSLSSRRWEEVLTEQEKNEDGFLGAWLAFCRTSKALGLIHQFMEYAQQSGGSIRPRYTPLLITGRTSASRPNVQQAVREDWFRRCFVARPRHQLYVVDYAFIELRTLAATCLRYLGSSRLAETIREGRDPHVYTAALFMGQSYESFSEAYHAEKKQATEARQQGKTIPTPFQRARQAAKACNFGVPGGLGAQNLAQYARSTYGVDMTPEEARAFRERLIDEVYPELREYLKARPEVALAYNLRCSLREASLGYRRLQPWYRASQQEMPSEGLYRRFVEWLEPRSRFLPKGLKRALEKRRCSEALERWLCGEPAVTLTGRIRGGCLYTQSHNTPFQGLAADGAKIALWRLWLAGFRVVAFIHDEFVLEIPEDQDLPKVSQQVQGILNESMQEVLGPDVPCEVEGVFTKRWIKG